MAPDICSVIISMVNSSTETGEYIKEEKKKAQQLFNGEVRGPARSVWQG